MRPLELQYQAYEFNEDEILAVSTLTDLQRAGLQTKLAMAIDARVALRPDPNSYADFIQTEAHYKGRIECLQEILREDEEARNAALQLQLQIASENKESNRDPYAPGYTK